MLRYKEIKRLLMEEVARHKPGDRLPSRPALCRTLDTTRTTLDKAIAELMEEGVLTARNGSGTYVVGLQEEGEQSVVSIAVVVPNNLRKTYRLLVNSLENKLSDYGVNIILCNSGDDAERQKQQIQRLVLSGVAGFVIVPAVIRDHEKNFRLCTQLLETKIPFVFCYRGVEGIDAPLVTSNNFYGGYIAAKHMIEMGYRNLVYISSVKFRSSVERFQGFVAALEEHGLPVDYEMMVLAGAGDDMPEGYTDMRRILHAGRPVDGVVAYNDRIARGAAAAIVEAGYTVSDDIGLIGYENEELGLEMDPRLTTVAMENVQIGDKAAEVLWQMVQRQPIDTPLYYVFHPELVERASCLGPVRGLRLQDTEA